MRIKLSFNSVSRILSFNYDYHEKIQAMIYHNLPDDRVEMLHDKGFPYEKRSFKLFTFSRIIGKRSDKRNGKSIEFFPPVHIFIASPIDWIIQELAEGILKREDVYIGKNQMHLESISVHSPRIFTESVRIRMLSPMAISSTFEKPEGKKVRHYYVPGEKDFNLLMSRNLHKKYFLVFNQERKGEIEIERLSGYGREHIIKYKGTVIKAWDGKYELRGDPELIQISYDCGLGEKNSQGFGMWEEVRDFTAEARREQT